MKIIGSKKNGITLIELILTLSLMAIVIQIIFSFYFVSNKSFETSKEIGFAQQDVRLVADYITNELKYARNIFTTNSETEPCYAIALNDDGNIVRYTYNGSEVPPEVILKAKIEGISFKNVNIDGAIENKRLISITIRSKILEEGGNPKFKLDEFEILLENIRDYTNPIDNANIIYYTK